VRALTVVVFVVGVLVVVGGIEHLETPVRQLDHPATVDQTVAALQTAVISELAAVQVL